MIIELPTVEQLRENGCTWLDEMFDIRSLLLPRPGEKFVLCDSGQIEPRILASLAGNEKMLEAIRNGYGVYEAAAVKTGMYTGPKGGFKKQKALYQAKKAQVLALGYQAGWETYIEAAMALASYDVCKNDTVSEKTGKLVYGSAARKEVAEYRAENPEVVQLWASLDEQFRNSVGSNFVLELPSGRVMTYRNVQRSKKKKARRIINEETGELIETKIEDRWVYTAEIDGRRYELYGGLLTENAVQATARDAFSEWKLRIEKNIAPVLWDVYDEVICSVPLDFDPKVIENMMRVPPSWLPNCPFDAEAKEAAHYLK